MQNFFWFIPESNIRYLFEHTLRCILDNYLVNATNANIQMQTNATFINATMRSTSYIRKTNIWHSQYNQTIIINFLEMHMI